MARSYIAIAATCFVVALLLLLPAVQHDNLAAAFPKFGHWLEGLEANEHALRDDLSTPSADYLLGVGKGDITGPVVELNFMGYANISQIGTGLKQRLYSRAFIVGSPSDPNERVVYLVLDTQSGDTAIRYGILEGLKALGPGYSMYGSQNVAVTGTHSHSGPGAWLNYLLPQITSKGFSKQSYEAIVAGAVLSIKRAHDSLKPGNLEVLSGDILDASVSRSPYAYLANPEEERKRYKYNVDKTMTQLKFISAGTGKAIGVLNWFPVHGTSMLGNNTLVTGDNKGVAAYLLERHEKDPAFVAGFSQSNVGDTSPNINGAWCEDGSGVMCSFERSLCANNKSEACHGRGPYFGLNDGGMKSCYEIGKRQYKGALSLFQKPGKRVSGSVRSFHTFYDFGNFTFTLANGSTAKTCSAALGYSFAAGTTDGPGAFDFKQNSTSSNDASPVWAVVGKALHNPSKEQIKCQQPKPILLDVGASKIPYQWTPNIVDIQLLRIGQLVVIVSPGEATTMSGRRWKEAIASKAQSIALTSSSKPIVVLGGPANTYTHYIATEEEYGVQRYEGASTLYGPHTLEAYINITTSLLPQLASSTPVKQTLGPGPQPPININNSLNFIQPVVFDRAGLFKSFGQIVTDVKPRYSIGDRVIATFVGANPRNNLRLEGTFAMIERQDAPVGSASLSSQHVSNEGDLKQRPRAATAIQPYLTDADWSLTYAWRRTSEVAGTSEVDITWDIESGTPAGQYRVVYYGDAKPVGGGSIQPFVGRSAVFTVG